MTTPPKMFDAYVSSCSSSIGWGGQGGSLSMKLIEDPDNGVTISLPDLGTPVYFKYGTFYVGGLFQRFTYSESVSGGRVYDIVIESPSKLMDGVQCVIENFMGTTDYFLSGANQGFFSTNILSTNLIYGNIENVYNLFGFYENPYYGGYFGGSNFNSSGMEVDAALFALGTLAQRGSPHPLGGPVNINGNFINVNVDVLFQTVQGIWNVSQDAYRIKGPSKSINGLVSEICEAIQLDYFYDIVPDPVTQGADATGQLPDGGGEITDPTVVVKVVSKQAQPTPDAIEQFITTRKATGDVISYSMGKEFGDATTQKLVWGGRRTRYQVIHSSMCSPIWGKSAGGMYNTQGPTALVHSHPSRQITISLGNDFNNAPWQATLFEIRMAMQGKQSWEIFKTFETIAGCEPNGYNNIFTCPWTGAFDATKDVLNMLANGAGNAADTILTSKEPGRKQYQKSANELGDKIFAAVSNVSNNYYCQQFLVPLAGESTSRAQMEYVPPGSYEIVKAWEISDAAFLQLPMAADIKFRDGQGKQKSMCGWGQNPNYDYSGLGSDYDVGLMDFAGTIVSTKGSPDKEQMWDGWGHWVPFNAGATVKSWDHITTPDFGLSVLASYFFGLTVPPSSYFDANFNGALQFAIPPDNVIPEGFGIPQESTRYNYGPWVTLIPSFSPEGKAEVIADESMRPEVFGGYANLQAIGGVVATAGVARMTANESGTLELVGKPEGAIGERFANSGPYCTNIDVSIDATGGIKTSYKFNTWTPNFGKLAKYNIDRIASINKASWNFAKKLRDRVEKRPFPKHKFEKMDLSQAKRHQAPNVGAINGVLGPGKQVNHNKLGVQGGGAAGNANMPGLGNLA